MEYIIDEENLSKRLDMFLVLTNPKITRSYLKTLIKEGQVTVNGINTKAGYFLKKDDVVVVNLKEETFTDIVPENISIDIVYEDEDIIIVNKEKGMVVHPASGNYTGTLVNALTYSHKDTLSSINGIVRPGIVHRIDKDTTGIIVIAKNDNAHKSLSDKFKEHDIDRKYIALVKGIIKEDNITISKPIGRSQRDRKKMAVTDKNSKEATTHIKVLKRYYNSSVTMVEATLETGRTHQIRVHLSYIGHPLIGDEAYSKKDPKLKIKGQMLHAKCLGFNHPRTNEYVYFESEPPAEFNDFVELLEKRENN